MVRTRGQLGEPEEDGAVLLARRELLETQDELQAAHLRVQELEEQLEERNRAVTLRDQDLNALALRAESASRTAQERIDQLQKLLNSAHSALVTAEAERKEKLVDVHHEFAVKLQAAQQAKDEEVAELQRSHAEALQTAQREHAEELAKLKDPRSVPPPAPPAQNDIVRVTFVRACVFYCVRDGVVRDFHLSNPTRETVAAALSKVIEGLDPASATAILTRGVSVFEGAIDHNCTMTVAHISGFSCNVRGLSFTL